MISCIYKRSLFFISVFFGFVTLPHTMCYFVCSQVIYAALKNLSILYRRKGKRKAADMLEEYATRSHEQVENKCQGSFSQEHVQISFHSKIKEKKLVFGSIKIRAGLEQKLSPGIFGPGSPPLRSRIGPAGPHLCMYRSLEIHTDTHINTGIFYIYK